MLLATVVCFPGDRRHIAAVVQNLKDVKHLAILARRHLATPDAIGLTPSEQTVIVFLAFAPVIDTLENRIFVMAAAHDSIVLKVAHKSECEVRRPQLLRVALCFSSRHIRTSPSIVYLQQLGAIDEVLPLS